MFTQVIIQKQNMDGRTDGWTTDWPTDRHTDIQCKTIIPGHYRVAGYKKNIRTYIHSQPEGTYILISSQKRAAMSENVPSESFRHVCIMYLHSLSRVFSTWRELLIIESTTSPFIWVTSLDCFFFFFFFSYPQIRGGIHILFFLFLDENICFGYSLEMPRQGASNEYPQHMFLPINKKIINTLRLQCALSEAVLYIL